MSKVINFPKTSEKHHQPSPESDQPQPVPYSEISWESLAQEVPFNDTDSAEPEPYSPENAKRDNSSTEFDDIANMLVHYDDGESNPEDFSSDRDTQLAADAQESEATFDRDTEAAIAGNFLSHLAIQLDKSKKPDERQKLTELTAIGEDYFGYIIDDEDDKTPAEIREHLAKKYDKLSKIYQRENRQRLASLYNYRAGLTRTNFADYYENFASTHGRDDVFEAKPDQPSVKPSPDALPTELII